MLLLVVLYIDKYTALAGANLDDIEIGEVVHKRLLQTVDISVFLVILRNFTTTAMTFTSLIIVIIFNVSSQYGDLLIGIASQKIL